MEDGPHRLLVHARFLWKDSQQLFSLITIGWMTIWAWHDLSVPGIRASWVSTRRSTRRRPNVELLLGQRRRRWPNINPTLGRRLVFPGITDTDAIVLSEKGKIEDEAVATRMASECLDWKCGLSLGVTGPLCVVRGTEFVMWANKTRNRQTKKGLCGQRVVAGRFHRLPSYTDPLRPEAAS